MIIRHHDHGERIARITQTEAGWHLAWFENWLEASVHDTALAAVAAARDAYPAFLRVEDEEYREDREREEYEERFVRRQAGAVARAVRTPAGGQKGWQTRRPTPSDTEK
jgi:hypothetical protein